MIQAAHTYRSKEQVLKDLSRALHFNTASLERNRKGRLSGQQVNQFIGRCVKPFIAALVFAVAPFLLWSTGFREHGLMAALGTFVEQFTHIKDLIEIKGRLGAGMMIGSSLACFGIAIYSFSRISFALYFDLLDRKVIVTECRVTGREDQVLRENGRDPIEKYYFNVLRDTHQVSLAAFRALESGSVYLTYILPRSRTLVSIEPKTAANGKVSSEAPVGSIPSGSRVETAEDILQPGS